MKLNVFGTPVTLMRIGKRQLALRSQKNKSKSDVVMKSIPAFVLTEARKNYLREFVPAMISRRGKSLESNVAFVRDTFNTRDFGGSIAAETRKRIRQSKADAFAKELTSGVRLLSPERGALY